MYRRAAIRNGSKNWLIAYAKNAVPMITKYKSIQNIMKTQICYFISCLWSNQENFEILIPTAGCSFT